MADVLERAGTFDQTTFRRVDPPRDQDGGVSHAGDADCGGTILDLREQEEVVGDR